ncbi:MAG: protein-glutamate O-methyltransferase CheR [Bdellovibrionales bacterium]|nr:protein-glutamate O-methyltransferase CheR [Bdellovibrionales bacterium]
MAIQVEDFRYISELVRNEAAIVLETGKEYLVETRLGPIVTQEGLGDISALVKALKENPLLILRQKVVDALTTNETSFFRDVEPFDVLREVVLPDLIERRKAQRKMRIWCAAASTGQELYSIAMIIRENFPELLNWDLRIQGTDINQDVLDKAKSGVYNQMEVNRGLPAKLLIKYFEKEGKLWKIKSELREMIKFSRLNLIKPWGFMEKTDIIFVRNVLIYFDRETKQEIFKKMKAIFASDGYLFLGAAETTLGIDESFQRHAVKKGGCYQLLSGK